MNSWLSVGVAASQASKMGGFCRECSDPKFRQLFISFRLFAGKKPGKLRSGGIKSSNFEPLPSAQLRHQLARRNYQNIAQRRGLIPRQWVRPKCGRLGVSLEAPSPPFLGSWKRTLHKPREPTQTDHSSFLGSQRISSIRLPRIRRQSIDFRKLLASQKRNWYAQKKRITKRPFLDLGQPQRPGSAFLQTSIKVWLLDPEWWSSYSRTRTPTKQLLQK